jgi:hypothetical protein
MEDGYEKIKEYIPMIETLRLLNKPIGQTYECTLMDKKEGEWEIFCFVWNKGAETVFHSHPEGGCWLVVIEGILHEIVPSEEETELVKGSVGFKKGKDAIHKIICKENAISIHLYKPGRIKPNFK